MSVNGGSIQFDISINRRSIQRAISDVERAFSRANPQISFNRQQVAREAAESARRARRVIESQVDDIPIEFKLDENGLLGNSRGRFVSSGRDAGQGFSAGFAGSIAIGNIAADAAQAAARAVVSAFQGAGQAIGSALGANVDFESARSAAATLVDDVDALTAALDEQRSGLAGQVSQNELLAASYDVLSAGFTEAGEAAEITGQSARGAIAGFSDVGTVTDAVTTILNSYSSANLSAAEVVDQLVKTQNLGKITVDQYAQSIGRASSIAATAGVGFEEFNAAVAAATAAGVAPESAVSGIRQAILNLIRPTEDAKEALEQFGIENAAAALRTEGLAGVLRQLSDQGISNQELANIFTDVDGLAAIAPIAGENIGRFNEALEGIGSAAGTTDDNLEILTQTIPALQKQFQTLTEDGLLAFGRALGPTTAALLEFANSILQSAAADFGGFDQLIRSGERLGAVLEDSPETIDRLGGAFAASADEAVEQIAEIIDAIADFASNDQAVENVAQSIEEVGLAFEKIGGFSQGVIETTETLFSLGSAGENAGAALRGAFNATSLLAPFITSLQLTLNLVEDIAAQFDLINQNALDSSQLQQQAFTGAATGLLSGSAEVTEESQVSGDEFIDPDAPLQAARSAEELAKAQREALEQVADDTASALAEIETSQAQQIAAIRQRQLDGVISEEDAAGQIAAIQANSTDQIIAEKQRELAEVQRLKVEGVITEAQAAQEITALQGQIADETLSRLDQEIAAQERAKQAALDKLDSESDRIGQLQNIRDLETEIANTTLDAQQSLLSAQQSLASSRSDLAQLELEGALQRAEAEGDINAATQIRGQLQQQQQQALAQEQRFKQQQLNLQIQQNQLESQRAIQLAEVAAIEADIAVQRARTEGASSEEISGLERIADLRNTQVDQAREAAANQDAINGALQEQLNVEGQIAQEKARQAQQDEDRVASIRQAAEEQRRLQDQLADSQQSIDNALGGAFQVSGDDPRQNIRDIENQFRSAQSAGLFDSAAGSDFQQVLRELNGVLGGNDRSILQAASRSADQELFGSLLSRVGRGDLASLVSADSQIDQLKQAQAPIITELQDLNAEVQVLNEKIETLANSPRALTVQTPDPVADAGRIVSQIQRNRFRDVNA